MNSIENRRQHIRIGKSIEIKYKIKDTYFSTGSRCTDISKTGIRMPVFQRLKPGTVLELEIRLRETIKPILAIGEVMWLNRRKDAKFPFEIGIRFIKISPIADEIITGFINSIIEENTK